MTNSPRIDGRLHRILQVDDVDSVAITSGERDVCIPATVLGAIDRGYEVKLLSDAVSSGVDETHDTTLRLLGGRFSVQVDVLTTDRFELPARSTRLGCPYRSGGNECLPVRALHHAHIEATPCRQTPEHRTRAGT